MIRTDLVGKWPCAVTGPLAALLLLGLGSGTIRAEVTLDGTLGPAGALPGPDYRLPAELGRQVGTNLFHSFGLFNINTGESATFSGPSTVENILNRVTGGTASSIDGLLRTDFPGASPNLFLMNPSGVMFGPNAQIDVHGSFHVSTADFIRLADGGRFTATPSAEDALLTTAPPTAFGFLDLPAPLAFQGSALTIPEGQTLSVIGGAIKLAEGSLLQAPGGRVNVASVASAGEVSLGEAELGAEAFRALGSIEMTQDSKIDVSGTGGGSVFIRGGQLVMEHSFILGDTRGSEKGGNLSIKTDRLQLEEGAQIRAATFGPGRGGNLTVEADDILLEGWAQTPEDFFPSGLFAVALGEEAGSGDAGNLTVKAGRLQLEGGAEISVDTLGPGRGGNLTVEADEILLKGSALTPKDFLPPDIAELHPFLRARLLFILSGLFADAKGEEAGSGDAGNLTVKAGRLQLEEGANISASTFGPGRGGNLTVEADEILLEGGAQTPEDFFPSGLAVDTLGEEVGSGDAGDLTVEAGRLQLKRGAGIGAGTFGPGSGGNLTVEAQEILLKGLVQSPEGFFLFVSGLFTSTLGEELGSGDAGDLTVKAGRLHLEGGAVIDAATFGPGRGGNLTVEADEILLKGGALTPEEFIPSGLFASQDVGDKIVEGEDGDAGDLTVKAGRLQLEGGARIRAGTFGLGSGGNLTVEADEILLEGGALTPFGFFASGLFASQDVEDRIVEGEALRQADSGDAGDLTVKAARLQLEEGAAIHAGTFGPGSGGNLTVEADDILLEGGALTPEGFFSSGLFTSAQGEEVGSGDAGDLTVHAGHLGISNGATISAETFGPGLGGKLFINAANIDLRDGGGITSQSESDTPTAGRSGEIFIHARDALRLFNESHISVETAQAEAGDISLNVGSVLHLRDQNSITTSVAGGLGSGGNILIDPTFVILDEATRIIAQAREGRGGNIHITTDFLFKSPESVIDASSEFGVSGTVEIDSPDTDLTGGITALPESFFDATALLRERCGVRAVREQSSLVIRGGSIPPEPDRYLSASYRGEPGSVSVHLGIPDKAKRNPGRSAEGLELGCGD